jgi:hypothetical protein
VLDVCGGSGNGSVAALLSGHRALYAERSEVQVAKVETRLRKLTERIYEKHEVHVVKTFEKVRAARAVQTRAHSLMHPRVRAGAHAA